MRKKRNRYKSMLDKLPLRKKKRGAKVMYKFISRKQERADEKTAATTAGVVKI